jgi:hypothetical protein
LDVLILDNFKPEYTFDVIEEIDVVHVYELKSDQIRFVRRNDYSYDFITKM